MAKDAKPPSVRLLDHSRAWAWVKPWPVTLGGQHPTGWNVDVLLVSECLDALDVFWPYKGERVRARSALRNLKRWFPIDHHISQGIANAPGDVLYRPVVMVIDGRIIDGNHRLMALGLKRRMTQPVLVLWHNNPPAIPEADQAESAEEKGEVTH